MNKHVQCLLSAPLIFGWRRNKLDNRRVLADSKGGANHHLNVKYKGITGTNSPDFTGLPCFKQAIFCSLFLVIIFLLCEISHRWNCGKVFLLVHPVMCYKYIYIKEFHFQNIHQWINQYIILYFESFNSFLVLFYSIS